MLDPFDKFEVKDSGFEDDRAIYALDKFFRLCADNNPSIVELLFVPDKCTNFKTEKWDAVLENKHLFLSKNLRYRYTGFAVAQLRKLQRHREWFQNPPDHKPTRKEYGLKDSPLVSEGSLQNVLGVPKELFLPQYHEELVRERAYRDAKKRWDNFYQWQTTRNPKRKGAEELYGYDTKCAINIFRLLSEGESLLLTGNIEFPLPNADWLIQIKQGFYTYEQLLEMTEGMEERFNHLYEISPLPKSPNRNKLTELYYELVLN